MSKYSGFLLLLLFFSAMMLRSSDARAQTDPPKFSVGGHIVSLEQRAFSKVDCGFGSRFTFHPIASLGIEGEINIFLRDLGKPAAFSGSRTEALFGVKAGRRLGPFGFFGKLRPGFVRYGKAPRGMACIAILIWPPPLECSISMGATNFALDFGGVIESYPSRHTMIRLDLGDTMIRFRGPASASVGRFKDDFNVHNFQLNVGFGFRF
jgi:hypothetical protein